MLTPWLPPPSLTWDILSIPDMMLHSPLYLPEPWTGGQKVFKKNKTKKSSHPTLLVFSAWSGEACMQPEEGWRDKCAAHFFVSHNLSCPKWFQLPSGPVQGFVLCWTIGSIYFRDSPCTIFTVLRLWFKAMICSLKALCLTFLPLVWLDGQAHLASFSVGKPLDDLW